MPRKRRYLSNTIPIARTDKTYVAPFRNIHPIIASRNPVNSENELYLRSMYNPTQSGDYKYYGDSTYNALDSILMRRAYEYDAAAKAYGQGLSIPFGPAYNRREKARKAYGEARNNLNNYRKNRNK